MGDVAESILEGVLCQECGTYIGPSVGFPRSCTHCLKGVQRKPRKKKKTKGDNHAQHP